MNFEDYMELCCQDQSPGTVFLDRAITEKGYVDFSDLFRSVYDHPYQMSGIERQMREERDWGFMMKDTSEWPSHYSLSFKLPEYIPKKKRKKRRRKRK